MNQQGHQILKKSIAGRGVALALALAMALTGAPISALAATDYMDYFEAGQRYYDVVLDSMDKLIETSQFRRLRDQVKRNYGVVINPYLKMGLDFTDNVFKAPKPPGGSDKEDTIWKITPGVTVTHQNGLGRVGVSYEADFNYFGHQERNNEQDQSFAVVADIFPAKNLYVRAQERLSQRGATAGGVGLKPVNYLDNTVGVVIGHKREKTTLEIGYENFVRDYNSEVNSGFNYHDNKFTGKVLLNDSPEFFGEVTPFVYLDVGKIKYINTPGRDTAYVEIGPGFEGRFPGNITGSAKVAFQRRNLRASARNNATLVTTTMTLKKQFNNRRTSAELAFFRRPVEATFGRSAFFDEKLVYTGVTHLITKKLRGKVGLTYANRDHEDVVTTGAVTVHRSDHSVGLNVGADFAARQNMVFNIAYQFNRNNSNNANFDYTENRLALGMTILA